MIHVLVIVTMKERQLLIAISGVIGAVKIKNDPFGSPFLIPPDIHLEKLLGHPVQVLCRYRVLKP